MKKLLIIPALFLAGWVSGQSLSLQTMCLAAHTQVGDTVTLGAILYASNDYSSITYKQLSGPNTAVVTYIPLTASSYTTGQQAQQDAYVTGLAVGTYLFQVTGTDQKGGSTTGIDSIIVTAATPGCPPVPAPPTFTGATVTIFGIPVPIAKGATTITFTYNGTTQTVTF